MADFLYDSTEKLDTHPQTDHRVGVTVGPIGGTLHEERVVKLTTFRIAVIERVHGGWIPVHSLDMEVKEQTRGVIENLDRGIAYLQAQRLRLADELGRLESGGAEEILEAAERMDAV